MHSQKVRAPSMLHSRDWLATQSAQALQARVKRSQQSEARALRPTRVKEAAGSGARLQTIMRVLAHTLARRAEAPVLMECLAE